MITHLDFYSVIDHNKNSSHRGQSIYDAELSFDTRKGR